MLLRGWPQPARLAGRAFAAEEAGPPADVAAPDLPSATVDAARQAQARRYARQRHRLLLANLALTAALVAVVLFSGLAFWLRDALTFLPAWAPVAGFAPARVAGYFLALFLAYWLLDLPLSYIGGYVLPHRYGLSTQTQRAWAVDEAKGLVLSLVFEVAAVEVLYLLLAAAPQTWWLWASGAALLVTVVLAQLAPILLLPLFYKLTPLPEGEVRRRALALAERAGTRVGGVYAMNLSTKTTAANAAVMGLGATRRIVLGDTLLRQYTLDEIEVVLAHELGHQVHRDIPKLIVTQVLGTLGALYIAHVVLQTVVQRVPGYAGLADPATLPLVAATLGVVGFLTLPLLNAYSRHVERQADAYALATTGKGEAFISAMSRLANQNLAEAEPPPLIEALLYSHPSIGKRLAHARAYAAR